MKINKLEKTGFIPLESKKFPEGFTLIEVLLGVSIFSIIALSLYSTFFGGLKLNKKTEQINKIYQQAKWTFAQIEEDLDDIASYDFINSYEDQTAFSGTDEEMTFMIKTDDGLKFVTYKLAKPQFGRVNTTIIGKTYTKNAAVTVGSIQDNGTMHFLRENSPFVDHLAGEAGEVEVYSSIIKEGGISLQYADRTEDVEGQYDWHDAWDKPYLPIGVRVQLTLVDQEQKEDLTLKRDFLVTQGFWSKPGKK